MKPETGRTRATLIAAVLLVGATVWSPPFAGAQSAEEQQDEVRDQKAAVDAQVDVLQASNAEINARLDQIDTDLAAANEAVASADAAVDAAEADARSARIDLRHAEDELAALRGRVQQMAIASYIHPPTYDMVTVLTADDMSSAVIQRSYLDARAQRDVNLLNQFEAAESKAAERAAAVEAAVAAATNAAQNAVAERDSLQAQVDQQAAFAADLRMRIDASLAESAALAEFDTALSQQIAAEQAALLARIPPEPEPAPDDVPDSPDTPSQPNTPVTTTTAPSGGGDPSPTTTRPPTTTTTPPPVDTVTPPLRTVQGIRVNEAIADRVDALLTASRADGIPLYGWGYRSTDSQIALREAHCGSTYYDIWLKPASQCSPPTAIPGRSMHERGLAIDFTYNGVTISSRSNAAFKWLAANAATYGLYNLPSEPWHWSTTGG